MRFSFGLSTAFCILSLGAAPVSAPTSRPYSGLTLRDDDSGKVLVSHIAPGPLEGRGFRSPHLERGDTILSVNGRAMTAKEFDGLVQAGRPGDVIILQVRRTGSPNVTAIPTAAADGKLEELQLILADAAHWVGPVAFPNRIDFATAIDAIDQQILSPTTQPTPLEAFIDENLERQQITAPTAKLCDMLASTQEKNWGVNALSRVAYGFVHPKRMLRLQKAMTDPLPQIAADPVRFLGEAAMLLDLTPTPREAMDLSDPHRAADELATRLDLARADVERAFTRLDPEDRAKQAERMDALLRHIASPEVVESSPRVNDFIRAMQATMGIDYSALFSAAGHVSGIMSATAPTPEQPGPSETSQPASQPTTVLPQELDSAVKGSIIAIKRCEVGWIVVGGPDENTYDMSKVAAVIDVGGNDTYLYPEGPRASVQVIIDRSGNDRYIANGNGVGPAAAVMGISLINDCAGDDVYQGGFLSCGAGVMGIGVLLDRSGNDHYEGSAWCEGAGVYGAGAIIDLAGGDTYLASVDSQAIGGPKGVGLILDADGADVYRANGPLPSAYDTPAVAYAMSQGVGLGFRRFDSGGIGIIEDLAGNDRYEGGEFSQGGGYYFGLGMLHDRSGSDVYFGNRYSQAFAAHQAIGILVDDAGDDTYWSMTAAGQSGSWDKCITVLLDRAGNDTYRGDGLSQGSAAMQAIAWLIDLGGNDHYVAAGSAAQGQGGGNNYSYLATGCFSWSLLLDAGNGTDFYSSGRTDGQVLTTGALNEKQPEASDLSGLFIDTPRPFAAP